MVFRRYEVTEAGQLTWPPVSRPGRMSGAAHEAAINALHMRE